jgi:CheY-like chemotaxis protein
MLRELGCDVALVQHGAQAVEMYQRARAGTAPLHAVIMDLTIQGGMGNREAVVHHQALHPGRFQHDAPRGAAVSPPTVPPLTTLR